MAQRGKESGMHSDREGDETTTAQTRLSEGTNRTKYPLLVIIVYLEACHETQAGSKRDSRRYLHGSSRGSTYSMASLRYGSGDG
ncbi:hypothetical protein AGR1A_pAt20246 [Agrobacterium fabacearum CFBP 5771]|nr:hypothetical protein AGR1A_pAt20246 [Agrobacterium fabacearum CFBP 5771]